MSVIGVASLLFGGISGYRQSMGRPIDTSTKISYVSVSTPFIFFRGVGKTPQHMLASLLFSPIVNGLIICVGHHIGKVAYVQPIE
jgi:hypothetical protein